MRITIYVPPQANASNETKYCIIIIVHYNSIWFFVPCIPYSLCISLLYFNFVIVWSHLACKFVFSFNFTFSLEICLHFGRWTLKNFHTQTQNYSQSSEQKIVAVKKQQRLNKETKDEKKKMLVAMNAIHQNMKSLVWNEIVFYPHIYLCFDFVSRFMEMIYYYYCFIILPKWIISIKFSC